MQDGAVFWATVKDMVELIERLALAVGIAISSGLMWESQLGFPLRLLATITLFLAATGLLSAAGGLFLANREVFKLEPRKRTRRQVATAVLLLSGVVMLISAVFNVTTTYMSVELKRRQVMTSCCD